MENGFDFENLDVYCKAVEFVYKVYNLVEQFPQEERYALSDQFRRAATSVALNIAEGSGGSKLEFKRFLRIARRSVRECVAILTIARKRCYIEWREEKSMREKCIELSKMISGLMKSL